MTEPNEFEELVADIKQILGPISGINASEVDTGILMQRLRDYKSHRPHWQKYEFSDPSMQYTRNGVSKIDTKADLLVLVWTPGKSSAVHDHANAHCLMKVLQGTLTETLYDVPVEGHIADELHTKRITHLHENEVTYISDRLGLHKITNEGPEIAVSLHLYTPPWASMYGCNIYHDGRKVHVEGGGLYSDNGVRLAKT